MRDGYGQCLTCRTDLCALDDEPNRTTNPICARCRAEEEHDFDVAPDVVFSRSGQPQCVSRGDLPERFSLMAKRLLAAYRSNLGLHLTPGEVKLLALTAIFDLPNASQEPDEVAEAQLDGASHEERFALMSKRLRVAYVAGLGLECSRVEIQILGMTSIIDWKSAVQDQDE